MDFNWSATWNNNVSKYNSNKFENVTLPPYCISTRQITDGVMSKIIVTLGNTDYMLKTVNYDSKGNEIRNYITEFISSNIINVLGYNVQEVKLATYKEQECCKITLYKEDIESFKSLGTSTVGGTTNKIDNSNNNLYTLLKIYDGIKYKSKISYEEFQKFIYQTFCLDLLVDNFDRHPGNLGIIRVKDKIQMALLYDNGNSLYPKFIVNCPKFSDSALNHLVEFDHKSAVTFNGDRKNYINLLKTEYKNDALLKNELISMISNYYKNNTNIKNILNTVIDYNNQYAKYINFIEKYMTKRIELIERIVGD